MLGLHDDWQRAARSLLGAVAKLAANMDLHPQVHAASSYHASLRRRAVLPDTTCMTASCVHRHYLSELEVSCWILTSRQPPQDNPGQGENESEVSFGF